MKKNKSHVEFSKQERSGIFFLLLIIVLLQLGYVTFKSFPANIDGDGLSTDSIIQLQITALKKKALRKGVDTLYPFNPNFITDYKGYRLGMSVAEIDRLLAFRSKNAYVSSSKEFQEVTGISDSLLGIIAPYFKFPEWTKTDKAVSDAGRKGTTVRTAVEIIDLNKATLEELKSVQGIGEKLSERILKFRNRLGGFMVEEQLYDVYGLEAQVAERALKRFKVLQRPDIEKININSASVAELVKLVYIRYAVAQEIVAYRETNGGIRSFDELDYIPDFPFDKIDRIALYLSL